MELTVCTGWALLMRSVTVHIGVDTVHGIRHCLWAWHGTVHMHAMTLFMAWPMHEQ